jgi:hypothetical protein
MNRLAFWLAKMRGDEAALSRLGAAEGALLGELAGKRVAIVGNARALAEGQAGEAIDSADLVIRVNGAPMPQVLSHGKRTDWLGVSIPVTRDVVETRGPKRIVWVTPKRKRLPWWMARDVRFALYPAARHADLVRRLGRRPTTGLMLIDFVAGSEATAITLYGFDFFASQSLSGSRTAAEVPHDFPAEAAFVADLEARDARVRRG